MKITQDQLQNELLIISHHVNDIKESLEQGDIEYALLGLKDISESVNRLSGFIDKDESSEIKRMSESSFKTRLGTILEQRLGR